MAVILVSGKAGSGKSTFAQYLVKKNPEQFVEFTLAAKLKQITFKLLKLFNMPIDSIEDLDNRQTKEKYRHYLQQIGTEVMRSTFGDNFWCQQIANDILTALKSDKIVIISDIRFQNEQQYLYSQFAQDYKIYTVKIHRSIDDNIKSTHSSENASSIICQYNINNDNSIEQFYKMIDDIVFNQLKLIPKSFTTNSSTDDELIELPEVEPITDEVVERAVPVIELPNTDKLKYSDPIGGDETEYYKLSNNKQIQNIVANDKKFINMMTSNNTQNGSQQLGVIGESYVLELIQQQIRPKNETILVSSMPHVADIHSIDHINNIFWVIEVKNKGTLTPEDVDKFKRDLKRMTQQNIQSNLQVVGLFLSLRSLSIPKIGDVYITGNEIYLSKSYFTPEILKVVFSFVEQWKELMNPSITNNKQESINYVIPAQTLELFALLNTEYQHINRDVELYDSMRHNCSENLQHIEELTISAKMKQRLIYCLNQQISNNPTDGEVIAQSTEDAQYNMLIDYLKGQTSKSSIKKQTILQRYPTLTTQINRVGWNEFRDTVWELSHKSSINQNSENPIEMKEISEKINIPDYVIGYCMKQQAENKSITKKDLIKKYPIIRHDVEHFTWKNYKEQLMNSK